MTYIAGESKDQELLLVAMSTDVNTILNALDCLTV
jgi:hypothetical protein